MKVTKTSKVMSAEGLDSKQRVRVAKNSTDPKELSRLAYDNARSVRMAVLQNESTPQNIFERLCKEFVSDGSLDIRNQIAERTTDPQLIAKLADDKNMWVRKHVALNPSASQEILAKLADDEHWVRDAVARNPSASPEILAKLSDDKDAWISKLVARNPSASQEILAKLADAENLSIRWEVARNPHISPQLLEKLSDDPDRSVRMGVAMNPAASPEILAKLADDRHSSVRTKVAENLNTSSDVISKLAYDDFPEVRKAVVKKTEDPQVLAKLSHDRSSIVRREAELRANELGVSLPRGRSSAKSPSADWSVPLYSIENYSEIENEIDDVIHQAANQFAKKYLGGTADLDAPSGVYDNGGEITITFKTPEGTETVKLDAEDVLAPATSQNKKSNCVKTLVSWMTKTIEI